MITNILILAIAGGMLIMEKVKERKKMIDLKISRDDIKAIMLMAGEYKDNSYAQEDIDLAERIRASCRLWMRRGEPRDKELRKAFPIKKKEAHRWGW